MYTAELLLSNTHYHCSRLLARSQHVWLLRLLERDRLGYLLRSAAEAYRLLDLREELRALGNIRVKSINDFLSAVQAERLGPQLSTILRVVAEGLGYYNAVQFLADKHALLFLYGAYAGCHTRERVCVLEPRFEVEDHELNHRLERRRLLPYRLFDLLIAENHTLKLIELKYILSSEKNPRGNVPGGTLLAHIASFAEKLVSTLQLLDKPLQEAGYRTEYHFVLVLGPGRHVGNELWRHVEKLGELLEALSGTVIELHNTRYTDIASRAETTDPKTEWFWRQVLPLQSRTR